MFKRLTNIGRRSISQTRSLNAEKFNFSSILASHLTEAETQEKRINDLPNVTPGLIKNFSPKRLYDPFDFSMAKLNLDRKLQREAFNKSTFDTKRLNPLDYYTNPNYLSKYLTSTGRILTRDVTKLSLKNQRRLAKAVKRARSAGLLSSVHQDIAFLNQTNSIKN